VYLPKPFREDDPAALQAFMRDNAFAALVTVLDGEPFASHLPVTLHGALPDLRVRGHLAKGNLQVASLSGPGLLMFTGPHAYVSPQHYEARASVPTWNYQAVHARGLLRPLEDGELLEAVAALVAEHESGYQAQWDSLSATYREGMLRGIVGFEMTVAEVFGKYKLSQNRPRADQQRVAESLSRSPYPEEAALGRVMAARLAKNTG
jgi:transcriptional regulator